MSADRIVYCLEHLTDDYEFERLCAGLMTRDGYPSIEPIGGYHDRGRDALFVDRSTNGVILFAFSVRKDWSVKLREDARRIQSEGHSCSRLVFVTTRAVSAKKRDEAVENIQREFGWELDLYSIERLRLGLVSNMDLIRHHPAIFTPSFFPDIHRASDTPATYVSFRRIEKIGENAHYLARKEAGFEFRWASGESLGEYLSSGWEHFEWRSPDGDRFRACMGDPRRPGSVLMMRKAGTGGDQH